MLVYQKVGRFEIRDFLGRGGIGDVLLAWDPQQQAEVALKVVRVHKTDPDMLEAEKNGVALQAQLARVAPQVAAVHEQGEDEGIFWVCMEYVAGTDLSQVIARGPLPEDRAVYIALQLCDMLEACHEFSAEVGGRRIHGIVHGDIKPENIRLQEGERVRVLDFGIAKHLSQTRRFTTNLFGSLPYTPPERLERGVVDRQSDLWAVGVVLYIMVSGRRPFPGASLEELERHIRQGTPPLPLPNSVDPKLQKIIRKSMAFKVEHRYQTAAELEADLLALAEGRPLAGEAVAVTGEDLNVTRRTVRPPVADHGLDTTRRTGPAPVLDPETGATRRTHETGPAIVPPPPPPPAAGSVPPPPSSAFPEMEQTTPPVPPPPVTPARPRRRWRRRFLAIAGLFLIFFAMWQASLQRQAREIYDELVTNPSPDLDQLAQRYRDIDRATFIKTSSVRRAEEELREALVRSADRIIESYHGDSPSTTENGWRRAHSYLQTIVGMSSFLDFESRAKMLYCQAHIDRIQAQSLRQRGQRSEADERSREAVAAFRTAASRAPKWPDPFLGLARIYAYDQFDLEKLQESLGELERRGYELGRRERAMLADGFRMRGREYHARALRAQGTDQELGLLEQARDDFRRAIDIYNEISTYANVRENRADAANRLSAIEIRLAEMEEEEEGFSISFEIP